MVAPDTEEPLIADHERHGDPDGSRATGTVGAGEPNVLPLSRMQLDKIAAAEERARQRANSGVTVVPEDACGCGSAEGDACGCGCSKPELVSAGNPAVTREGNGE